MPINVQIALVILAVLMTIAALVFGFCLRHEQIEHFHTRMNYMREIERVGELKKEGEKESNETIGISDGDGGVISFCCHEGRHAECMGMTEVSFRPGMRIFCACDCHFKEGI